VSASTAVTSENQPRLATDLFALVNATRSAEGLNAIERSSLLDQLALDHAQAMSEVGQLAHDVGQGGPDQRVGNAQVRFSLVGENLARAATARRAHRALWASPSHRKNLLHPAFNRVGIGAVVGRDGLLWVCEIFAQV
jgi:uncharacterized protein YkwD